MVLATLFVSVYLPLQTGGVAACAGSMPNEADDTTATLAMNSFKRVIFTIPPEINK